MQVTHNICALDLGSWTSKLAVLNNQHKFEIIVNEANFRQTPTLISYTQAERLIGDQAVTKIKSNFRNTIRAPHRLIGLSKRAHLLQQQLKYNQVPYTHSPTNLHFTLQLTPTHTLSLTPQNLTSALFTKYKQIYQQNNIKTDLLFISIQSYLSNNERKTLKYCAQAAGFKNVSLVEEWQAIAAQYYFVRQKEMEMLVDDFVVVFVDFGYCHVGVHAVVFGKNRIGLVDQEYLRYSGSRNIDNLLLQFYLQHIQTQASLNLLCPPSPKSLIKLLQQIQLQRKKLSANTQNQLTIQCLLNDYDLSYNMKREQLQNISMPIIAQFASVMQSLRSRVQPVCGTGIHSVEVIGGLSRMPFMQDVVRSVFNMEALKKMNASQTVARGCAIAGANRLGLLRTSPTFLHTTRHPITILTKSHPNPPQPFLHQNPHLYPSSSRKIIFDTNSILPANTIVKIQGQNINQVLICQQIHKQINVIGYVRFKGSDNLTVLIDGDGIMRARLVKSVGFEGYQFGDMMTVEQIKGLKVVEDEHKGRDKMIIQSYQLRNQLQSQLYKIRQLIQTKLQQYSPPSEQQTILQILNDNQHWLSSSQQKNSQSYKQRLQTLTIILQQPNKRKQRHQNVQELRKILKQKIGTVSKLHNDGQTKAKLQEIQGRLVGLYNQEVGDYWNGKYLGEQLIREMIHDVDKLK